jgi:glycosyltransferase involved in cell wall biosynthesis
VPVGNWAALARAISQMLVDEDLRLRIARAAFRKAREEDADGTARAFQAIYKNLAAPRT